MKIKLILFVLSSLMIFISGCKKDDLPTLNTKEIIKITQKSASCGGYIRNNVEKTIIARGVCWSTNENPTTLNDTTLDGAGTGSFTSSISGLLPYTRYFVRAYATSRNGTDYGNSISFRTLESLTDKDGNSYETIKIGKQTWMTQDLKTSRLNDGKGIPYVYNNNDWIKLTTPGYCWYDNNDSYKSLYGNLYNWYAVNTGKLCPTGWHVPGDAEWLTLIDLLGGESVGGGKLKEIGTTHWMPPNTGATNESGFNALPSGNRIGLDGSFYNLEGYAIYWTSDQATPILAVNRVMFFEGANIRIGYDNKFAGFSVRCVKD